MKTAFQALVFLLLVLPAAASAREVVGWVEKAMIYVDEQVLMLKAKNDTGAKTSSLHCHCFNIFDKKGQKWVRFKVTNFDGETIELEKRIHRIVTIKRHGGKVQERPVIKLGICLGNTRRDTEVNLIDRSGLNYQLLIGRQFLENNFLIDSSKEYTSDPACDVQIKQKK